MPAGALVRELPWKMTPWQALERWPESLPLVALTSGDAESPFDQWTILGAARKAHRFTAHGSSSNDLLKLMRALAPRTCPAQEHGPVALPFVGGWIGCIGYECGALFEPRVQVAAGARTRSDDERARAWDAALCEVPRALVFSHQLERWFDVGDASSPFVDLACQRPNDDQWECETPASFLEERGVARFKEMVARGCEYIKAGDVFQVNLSLPLYAKIVGSARQFALDALRRAKPRYGAYLELDDDNSILSFSPELFLALEGKTGRVITRPMKGTRPSAKHAPELLASAKDAAELHMIVDLMRNDLGRVCRTGSVRVEVARTLESHPTVLQAVGEVSGYLKPECDAVDLIAACFPPGSVTGAPKIRAMQIIDELESDSRGAYCGAIGAVSNCGSASFSVAIRTAQLTRADSDDGWNLEYHAGCGIVADSNPEEEARELESKTRILKVSLDDQPTATR